MKKLSIIFAFICILILGNKAYSQATFKIGGTYADVRTSGLFYDIKPQANLFAGIHYQFFFSGVIGIEPGITYYKLSSLFDTNLGDIKVTRDYIGIPLLVKFFPNSIVSFGGGLQAGFLAKDNLDENFRNNKFDLTAQTQLTFTPIKQLGIEVGYNYGLTPYFEYDAQSVGDVQFSNGDGSNKFFYATLLINLR